MIALAKAVKGSLQGVRYPNNPKKVVIEKGIPFQKTYNLSSNDPGNNWSEFQMVAKMGSIKNKFIVAVLSPIASDSQNMSFEQWRTMAEDYAKTFGFTDNQWRWDVHGNTDERHLHIYASRLNFVGKNTVKEARIGMRSGIWAERYAQKMNWKTLEAAMLERKQLIKEVLLDGLQTATNFDDLKSALEQRGYTFLLSYTNKEDGTKKLNGMRIMTVADAVKRKAQLAATELAVEKGKPLLPPEIRKKQRLSPPELEQAKQLGLPYLKPEQQKLVLTKAQLKAKPGFTLSQLEKDRKKRLHIGEIVDILQRNKNFGFENKTTIKPLGGTITTAKDLLLSALEVATAPSEEPVYREEDLWNRKPKRKKKR